MKKQLSANLEATIASIAARNYLEHTKVSEWKVAIIALAIAKFGTMAASMYAGYAFFNELLLPLLSSTSTYFAMLVLVIIEVLTSTFLMKTFKFALRGEHAVALGLSAAVVVMFSLSFYSSTQGLAMRESKKVDATPLIIENHNLQRTAIGNITEVRIADLDSAIVTIKANPQLWRGGKRQDLSEKQLEQIQQYNLMKAVALEDRANQLATIDKAQRTAIAENNAFATDTALKYWYVAAGIMVFQFFSNFGLMFLFGKITEEEKPDEIVNENKKKIEERADDFIDAVFNIRTLNRLSLMTLPSLPSPDTDKEKDGAQEIEITAEEEPEELPDRHTVLGFSNQSKNTPTTRSTSSDRQSATSRPTADQELAQMKIEPEKKYIYEKVRKLFGNHVDREKLTTYGINRLAKELIDENPKFKKTTIKGVFDRIVTYDTSKKGGAK